MDKRQYIKTVTAALFVGLFSLIARSKDDGMTVAKPCSKHLVARGYFVKEENDKAWSIALSGKISSMCGIYVIIYDKNGTVVHHGKIPYGDYGKKPYTINIPKDGVSGDYKIKIIGSQHDFLGINLPLTDLKEVYYITGTSIGHDKGRYLLFQVPPGQDSVTLHAYKGHLKVKDDADRIVADTAKESTYGGNKYGAKYRYSNVVSLDVVPHKTYRIEPQAFYFGCKDGLYVMFNPDRWFFPDKKLETIKWWKLEYK